MKVINQLLCGVHLAAAGEAMAMARRQGLPLDLTLEILAGGAGSSWMLQDRGPRMVTGDFSVPRSAIDIFVKDLGLVADAARADRFAAPLAATALLAFLSVSGRGDGGLDDAARDALLHGCLPKRPAVKTLHGGVKTCRLYGETPRFTIRLIDPAQ